MALMLQKISGLAEVCKTYSKVVLLSCARAFG
jgi:hypothetical protein